MSGKRIAVVGGGPAGLYAAEVAAKAGACVTLFEAKASVGRKFLVAGRGGLNLTNAEAKEKFIRRYSSGPWEELIGRFDASALRHWAHELGTETFVASTGRVYPKSLKAAPLLRAWVQRLRSLGVEFKMHHRWLSLKQGNPNELEFDAGTYEAEAVIFALGGGSWPQTGSDGRWTPAFEALGLSVTPLAAANCGWEVDWPSAFLKAVEGMPLKNVAVSAGTERIEGELLITNYGVEGGAIYALGPILRSMDSPQIVVDLKPSSTAEQLLAKLGNAPLARASSLWKLSPAAQGLLAHFSTPPGSADELAYLVKHISIPLRGTRPIAEAISSAGGVAWGEINDQLMLKKLPGVFVAGEMIDWEAPTGGYLLQGCFASGARAANEAVVFVRNSD